MQGGVYICSMYVCVAVGMWAYGLLLLLIQARTRGSALSVRVTLREPKENRGHSEARAGSVLLGKTEGGPGLAVSGFPKAEVS